MERMLIKHLSGSKANQVEEFALKHHNELIFGRDVSATVKYDPDRDDLVGRQHAKISRDPNDANSFLVTDLNSTNGTFLNKQRLNGTMKLQPGDMVQFGPGGPEFQFDVEPRPNNGAKATRMVDASTGAGNQAPPTRMVPTGTGAQSSAGATAGGKPPGTVGKATVERMISQTVTETKKQQGRKFGLIAGVSALAVLLLFGVVLGGAYWYSSRQQSALKEEFDTKTGAMEKKLADDKAAAPLSAAEINDKYGKAAVYFEVAWRLINTREQSQAYHAYLSPAEIKSMFKANVASGVPLYVQVGDTYEPVLRYTKGPFDVPIGGVHTGSGFIVTGDGFVLTNRHVAAAWMSVYNFPQNTPPGIVLSSNYSGVVKVGVTPPVDWVPSNSQQEGGVLPGGRIKVVSPVELKGVNDTLDVTLPGKESRMAAQLKQVSDRHDVALVKIDVPGQLTKVEIYDNYDTLKKGEQVVVLGYPAASPRTYGVIKSNDVFNNATRMKVIPDPTVTLTNIGNIIRDTDKDDNKRMSTMGDVIQLATSETGSGNSGGPVFDMQGRVIGVFFAGSSRGGVNLTYAVPIRYGKEFLAGD